MIKVQRAGVDEDKIYSFEASNNKPAYKGAMYL
jgi:hypothetical protein